ncbi:MAG TPA: ATP-binding protein [Methylococcaceae bacterium]|nr:ATP-binding protein [Methylococcaceae bacterium]
MLDLTPTQAAPRIATLLSVHESRTLEFKRVSGKMVGKALETICAFANAEGGVLALGVGTRSKKVVLSLAIPAKYRSRRRERNGDTFES